MWTPVEKALPLVALLLSSISLYLTLRREKQSSSVSNANRLGQFLLELAKARTTLWGMRQDIYLAEATMYFRDGNVPDSVLIYKDKLEHYFLEVEDWHRRYADTWYDPRLHKQAIQLENTIVAVKELNLVLEMGAEEIKRTYENEIRGERRDSWTPR